MRIQGWELTISAEGDVRTAKHAESGTAVSINGRFIGNADVPREVFLWLIRPLLRQAWQSGYEDLLPNPYNGEPPNKDKEVS